jgi:VWFA-related protein
MPFERTVFVYCTVRYYRLHTLLVLLICRGMFGAADAQTLPARDQRDGNIRYNFAVQSQLVEVFCIVSKGKRLVPNLHASDFRLTEDGTPVVIDHLDNPDIPLQIVLMFDISSSVKESLSTIKEAARGFLESLNSEDRVMLVLFNSAIQAFPQSTENRNMILQEIRDAKAQGGTKLYEALLLAMQYLSGDSGRKAIVCFTDGQDTSSKASRTDVIDAATRVGYPIYIVGTGAGLGLSTSKMILNEFAAINGGRAFFIQSLGKLREAFAEVALELRSAYVLGYYTRIPADGMWHELDLTAIDPTYSVRARRGFVARRAADNSP